MLFNSAHDFFYILTEAEMQHLVSFVEYGKFKILEIEILPFDVVLDSSCGANKKVNSPSKRIGLIVN
jgi:hypothetical protein